MADVGILSLGSATNLSSTAVVGTPPVLQVIASANDTNYVHDNTNSTHTGTADAPLADMPADFATMDTLSVQLRYLQSGLSLNTWDSLRARVFRSDGSTPLTDERIVASNITTTSATNSGALAFTGLDTAAGKAVWDAAIVRLSWLVTRNKGGDAGMSLRATAGQITGTYTIETGHNGTAASTLIAPTVSGVGAIAFRATAAPSVPSTTVSGAGKQTFIGQA